MVNHVLTNKHTDGIINDNVAHGNQVCLDIQHHWRQYVIVTWQENTCSSRCIFAANYVLNFKIDNAYKLLRGKEVHDNNTHQECGTDQLIVEFEEVLMNNNSPTRHIKSNGRGVTKYCNFGLCIPFQWTGKDSGGNKTNDTLNSSHSQLD